MKTIFSKFRMIALMIVLVLIGSFGVTACGGEKGKSNSGKTVTSVDQLKEHYGEIADIALAIEGVSEHSLVVDYKQEKQSYVDLMEDYVQGYNGEALLNAVLTDVISSSGLTDGVITSYLTAIKNHIIINKEAYNIFYSLYQKYDELEDQAYSKYYNSNYSDELWAEYEAYGSLRYLYRDLYRSFGVLIEMLNANALSEQILVDALASVLYGYVNSLNSFSLISTAISELLQNRAYVEQADYDKTLNALKAMFNNSKELVTTVDCNVIVKAMLNASTSEKVVDEAYYFACDLIESWGGDSTYLTEKYTQAKDSIQLLNDGFGLSNKEKKEAYVEMYGTLLTNAYEVELVYFQLDFDTITNLAEKVFIWVEDGMSTGNQMQELVDEIDVVVKDFAEKAKEAALSDGEVEDIISAAKVLNKNGLGYFAEKTIPLLGYYQQFDAHVINSIAKEDISSLLYLFIKEFNFDYDGYGWETIDKIESQLGVLSLTVGAKTLYNAYNSFNNKSKFESAFESLIGSKDLLIETLDFVESIAKKCPTNINTAVDRIYNRQSVFASMVTSKMENDMEGLGLAWAGAWQGYIEEDLKDAYDSFVEYIIPVFEVIELYSGEDYTFCIPESSELEDVIDCYINGGDWFEMEAAKGTYKFSYSYCYDYDMGQYVYFYAGKDGFTEDSLIVELKDGGQIIITDKFYSGDTLTFNGEWMYDGYDLDLFIDSSDFPYRSYGRIYDACEMRLTAYVESASTTVYFYLEKV